MRRTTALMPWRIDGLIAIGAAALAVAGALGALVQTRDSDRLIAEIELQTLVTDAYHHRAIDCLDLARVWMGRSDLLERAQKSLDMSKGITLCLVKARHQARLDMAPLAACIREVETANTIVELGADGTSAVRPAC